MTDSTAATARTRVPRLFALAAATALVAACGAENGDNGNGADGADSAGVTATAEETNGAVTGGDEGAGAEPADAFATAELVDPDGTQLGTVEFSEGDGGTLVSVDADGLPAGFHGLHIHSIGECEPDSAAPDDPEDTGDFMSAGGHLAGEDPEAQHPDHAGDLPPLLVTEDGTAQLSTLTDRLDSELLLDEDGTSVMIHAEPDNLAHIPERYAPEGADEETLSAGDGGSRIACGVVQG